MMLGNKLSDQIFPLELIETADRQIDSKEF
jgi:hypothetical protein